MDRVIREYQAADLSQVVAAWESGTAVAHPFLKEDFIAQERINISDVYMPNAETWVIEQDGQVIGFIALIDSEVGGLFVLSEHHGTGAGKALMDKARQLRGALEVEVFEANAIGRKFYVRYGFEKIDKGIHEPTGNAVLRLGIGASN